MIKDSPAHLSRARALHLREREGSSFHAKQLLSSSEGFMHRVKGDNMVSTFFRRGRSPFVGIQQAIESAKKHSFC